MEGSAPESPSGSQLAWRDDLTGAWNRRYLRRLLTDDWAGLVAAHPTISLLVLDLDGFKPVNDEFGHAAGDRVLCWAADELRRGFREGDRLIRYGGDEFVVALPGVGADEARALAERARAGFAAVAVDDAASGERVEVPISFSIGVASYPDDGRVGEEVLAIADRRLYEEKRARQAARLAESAASPPRRARWVAAAIVTVVTAALAATFAVRQARRPPEPPSPALEPVSELSPAEGVTSEIVVRDEAAIRELRAEVVLLREALAEERAKEERETYESRIRELESRLAAAESSVAPSPEATAPQVDPATGMQIGERRTREELPSALADATESAGPPAIAAPAAPAIPEGAASALPPGAGGAVEVPPRLLRSVRPAYPPAARSLRREGTVMFLLTVNPEGRVTQVQPIGASAGFGFDEAAKAAARAAEFAPGTRGGVAVEMRTRLAIRFELDGSR